MDTEDIKTLLDVRSYLYQAYQVILGTEPSAESLGAFCSELTHDAFNLIAQADPAACKAAGTALNEAIAAWSDHPDSYLAQAQSDYMRQFVGPNKLQAPPWECVYTTKERMLFQEQTLIVRNCYRKEGYVAAQTPHVSDDHIAIELDFIAKLSAKASNAYPSDIKECQRLMQAMESFITSHLAVWIPDYAKDLAEAAPNSLYAMAASGCAAFISADMIILKELIEDLTPSEN